MKNSTTSKKNASSTKKGTATPQKEGISFSWVAKNIFAVVIVLFLLNKFVLDVQPGYNWAYNMLQKNLETIRHYSRTTTDNRFEMKLGLSHVYLRYVKENTPENAVILLPGKEAFYPEGEERANLITNYGLSGSYIRAESLSHRNWVKLLGARKSPM